MWNWSHSASCCTVNSVITWVTRAISRADVTNTGPKFCEAQGGGCMLGPLLSSVPFPPLSLFPSHPIRSRPLKCSYGVWGSATSPAEIELGAFYDPYNMTFGGSNFTNLPWVIAISLPAQARDPLRREAQKGGASLASRLKYSLSASESADLVD